MKKVSVYVLIFISHWVIAQDQESSSFIGINSELSYKMLDPVEDLQKVKILLTERQNGVLNNKSLVIGASLISILDYQKANTDSKFGYLMRHPTAANQIGKEVSEAVIHSFQVSLTAAVNTWLSAFAELLYSPEQSFGSGTITALARNQIQLRKGFILIGDLNKCPLYVALGKMDAPFGQTGSVNPFSNTTMWHAFGGLGYGIQLGFKKWNIDATLMAVQGGSQFRALNTPVGDSTNVPSQLNNFTADLNYTLSIHEGINFTLGGSYMLGSAYCQDFPVEHFKPCGENNPAVTYYGKLSIDDRLILKGGFATTTEVWPGTHNPTPPLDVFEASKVSSLDIGANYKLNPNGNVVYTISGEFSNFKAGPSGAPWDRQNQIILGLSGMIHKSSKLFIELFKVDGYAPLNFISGSNPNNPFPPGVTHSLSSANSFGIVIGGQITI